MARARRRWIRHQRLLDTTALVFLDETATSTLRLNIGSQRFEFRFTSEVRELKNGPAQVIEMPATQNKPEQGA